jgi:hypothetical protein
MLENLIVRDSALSSALSTAYLLQPGINRRARDQALQFSAQELLHGSALQGRSRGQLIPNSLRNVSNGDLDRHAFIMPAVQS